MPDQAAILLRRNWPSASDDVRASAWDAFHSAASPDDLATSLQGLSIPDDLKADLWDLKAGHYQPSKPVSAENFAPEGSGFDLMPKGVSLGSTLWNAAKAIPSGIASTVTTAYEGQQPGDELLGPARILAPLIRNGGSAAAVEAEKAFQAAKAGRASEAIGHGGAAVFPLAGPAAAAAGEDIGSGDPRHFERGGGNAIALVGSAVAPPLVRTVGPRVAAPLASIGEQLASKGKAIGPAAAELAKTGALEYAAHAAGLPPLMITAIRLGAKALSKGGKAAAETEAAAPAAAETAPVVDAGPVALNYGRQTARMRFGAEPTPTPHGPEPIPAPEPSPNAGGTLARDASGKPILAPTVEQAASDALEAVRQPEPPARVTLPPPAELPAGYAPRTTVPKAKAPSGAARAAAQAEASTRKSATMGPRNYFLRKPTAAADVAEPAARGPISIADLPESWRGRTGPIPTKTPITAAEADAVAADLQARGLSANEAIMYIARDKSLTAVERNYLMNALKKAARRKAG